MLHTRVVIRAKKDSQSFWARMTDFGIPGIGHTQEEVEAHPDVVAKVRAFSEEYDVVTVDFNEVG